MQTYYQFYWNKIDEESIRILRIFGESEDVIVPETIGGRAVMEYGLPCDTRFGCNFQYHPLRRMTCSKRTLWCKTPILTQFYVSVGWSY